MNIYSPNMKPYDVFVNKSHAKHIGSQEYMPSNSDHVAGSFAQALNQALENTNQLQLDAERLQIQMVTRPEEVDPHQVSIAQTKAELALSLAKAVTTRLVNGFKELQNFR